MPVISFILDDGSVRRIEAEENLSLMQVIVQNGLFRGVFGQCGGSMLCATCHVKIHPDWSARVEASGNEKTDDEGDMLELEPYADVTSRLSCQILITKALDGLTVILAR